MIIRTVCRAPKRHTENARARSTKQSFKLAVDNSDDKQHQHSDDGNRDDAVRSHPNRILLASHSWNQKGIHLSCINRWMKYK
jgi:hypothetical protein